jgi:hypothetical protein
LKAINHVLEIHQPGSRYDMATKFEAASPFMAPHADPECAGVSASTLRAWLARGGGGPDKPGPPAAVE